MKKSLTAATLFASLAMLTACGDNSGTQAQAAQSAANMITIAGSTTVAPVTQALADAFVASHPAYEVEVQTMGTGAGMTATREGIADIGLASRHLTADELTELSYQTFAIDGIAVVVNRDNTSVTNLSFEDVQAIFLGEITNWSQVGGEDQNIIVVSREAGSGARGAFEDLANIADQVAYDLIGTGSNGVLTSVEASQWAIGYVTYGLIAERGVSALSIENQPFSGAAALSGDYPFAIGFHMAYQSAAISEAARTFLDWVMSPAGQAVVSEQDYVAVN